jgi:hypothetical protein
MTTEQAISKMMRAVSKSRTTESRKQGGAKAWETRVENLRAKLARPTDRKAISRNQAGE